MRARTVQSRRPRGFTLIELVVSLTAALIVTLAVVGLSRSVTTTFNDEMRSSSAESSLRNAVDRIRQDLERASFMSSGNRKYDPKLHIPSQTAPPWPKTTINAVDSLAGIRLYDQGSVGLTAPYSALNNMKPDMIDITGNMTSADQFVGSAPCPTGVCSVCNGPTILLNADSGAMYRVRYANATTNSPVAYTAADQLALLESIFQPAGPTQPVVLRIVDLSTMTVQYGVLCGQAGAVVVNGVTGDATLHLQATPAIDMRGKGFAAGRLLVNPVHTVQYRLDVANSAFSAATDVAQMNLYRRYVFANMPAPAADECAGANVCGPDELIAEYAVDMKFAFNVDDEAVGNLGATPGSKMFDFGDSNNALYAGDVNTSASGDIAPQRIRSVRVRLATRSRANDRNRNFAGPPGTSFIYLYCADGMATLASCKSFARVRTMTTDVALVNQAGFYWP